MEMRATRTGESQPLGAMLFLYRAPDVQFLVEVVTLVMRRQRLQKSSAQNQLALRSQCRIKQPHTSNLMLLCSRAFHILSRQQRQDNSRSRSSAGSCQATAAGQWSSTVTAVGTTWAQPRSGAGSSVRWLQVDWFTSVLIISVTQGLWIQRCVCNFRIENFGCRIANVFFFPLFPCFDHVSLGWITHKTLLCTVMLQILLLLYCYSFMVVVRWYIFLRLHDRGLH